MFEMFEMFDAPEITIVIKIEIKFYTRVARRKKISWYMGVTRKMRMHGMTTFETERKTLCICAA